MEWKISMMSIYRMINLFILFAFNKNLIIFNLY